MLISSQRCLSALEATRIIEHYGYLLQKALEGGGVLTAKFEQLAPGIEPLCHHGGDARSGSSPNDRGAQQSGTVVPEYSLMTLHSTSALLSGSLSCSGDWS